jgi:hypothetical protein
LDASDNWTFTATATVSSRQYLSTLHLWSSEHAARQCSDREAELLGVAHYTIDHRNLAISAVLSAVAFLEALGNEVFQDAADRHRREHDSPRINALSDQTVARLGEFWQACKEGEKYVGVLDKLQMALLLADAEQFDAGAPPMQDAGYLVKIRNDLTHHRPISRVHGVEDKKYRDDGIVKRFPENQLLAHSPINPWFPDRCLGAGCAAWSATTARAVADEWSDRLTLPRHYENDLANEPTP